MPCPHPRSSCPHTASRRTAARFRVEPAQGAAGVTLTVRDAPARTPGAGPGVLDHVNISMSVEQRATAFTYHDSATRDRRCVQPNGPQGSRVRISYHIRRILKQTAPRRDYRVRGAPYRFRRGSALTTYRGGNLAPTSELGRRKPPTHYIRCTRRAHHTRWATHVTAISKMRNGLQTDN